MKKFFLSISVALLFITSIQATAFTPGEITESKKTIRIADFEMDHLWEGSLYHALKDQKGNPVTLIMNAEYLSVANSFYEELDCKTDGVWPNSVAKCFHQFYNNIFVLNCQTARFNDQLKKSGVDTLVVDFSEWTCVGDGSTAVPMKRLSRFLFLHTNVTNFEFNNSESIEKFSSYCFSGNNFTHFSSEKFPNLKKVKSGCFMFCPELIELDFSYSPNLVKIEESFVSGCPKLERIYVADENQKIVLENRLRINREAWLGDCDSNIDKKSIKVPEIIVKIDPKNIKKG